MQQLNVSVFDAVSKFIAEIREFEMLVTEMHVEDSRTIAIYCNRDAHSFFQVKINKNEDDDFDYCISKYDFAENCFVHERCCLEKTASKFLKELADNSVNSKIVQ